MLLNEPFPPADINAGYVSRNQTPGTAPRYHVVVKRHDILYRLLNQLHVFVSVLGVFAVIGVFLGVVYGILELSDVFETVYAIRHQQVP